MRYGLLASIGVIGALGIACGAWPMLSGRNFPGWLGRGLTRDGDLRARPAPAVFWRVAGGSITAGGLILLGVAIVMGSSPTTGEAQVIGTAIILVLGAVLVSSLGAWLFVIMQRHNLFP
jgi:hypothetical protein